MTASAHVDTFARDNLPPGDAWPDLIFELPELRADARAFVRRIGAILGENRDREGHCGITSR